MDKSYPPPVRENDPGSRKECILGLLLGEIEKIAGIPGDQIDVHANLFQMGLDSLMLTRFSGSIKKVFRVEIRMKQFYDETDTIDKLAGLIHEEMPADALPIVETPSETPLGRATTPGRTLQGGTPGAGASDSVLERVVAKQLDLMSRQLELLRNVPRAVQPKAGKEPPVLRPAHANESGKPAGSAGDRLAHDAADFRAIKLVKDALNPEQVAFIEKFAARYTRRTRKSKELIARYRPVFSDWINSLGFRLSLKEFIYPIYADRSEGSHLWDVDGNEYIDIAMGYGVNYLGHRPPFVTEAVEKQLKEGFHLGPQFNLTNEVAALICELTGVERVAFCNTGSEAVMTAMRLARAVTGRDLIALFKGSYHGNFDGILAIPTERGSSPMAPGTPEGTVADLMILEYGTEESLEAIRTHGRNLAAVLVEPVQTRNPSFQPREFLKRVREITRESGVALIFDEIVNGFRLAQGGAQAFYDIRADIVTYGKLIGGGIPASVVAGKAEYLDAIDGGPWDYGNTSVPEKGLTFFAGTFAKHPLAVAAMRAVLTHLKTRGPKLQEDVNARTAHFAAALNAFFEQENVSVRIRHCASFFIFESFGEFEPQLQSVTMDLMFYLLMEKGVYTWERRICYFSTVHTDEEVEQIIRAVKESVAELRAGGFPFGAATDGLNGKESPAPASSVQRRMYALSQLAGGDMAYHVVGAAWIDGRVDVQRLEDCFRRLIQRHESLRTRFVALDDGIHRQVLPEVDFRMIQRELAEDRVDAFLKEAIEPFDLSRPPLLRVRLARVAPERSLLVFDAHHIAVDGLSSNILVRELMHLYNDQGPLGAPGRYGDFVQWEQDYMASEQFKSDETFWQNCFLDAPPVLDLATDHPRPPEQSFAGGNVWLKTETPLTNALKETARKHGASLFMVLLAGYYVLLHRLTGREDMVVGIPTAGREGGPFENTVGMFVNTLAIRERPRAEEAFTDFLASLKRSLLNGYDHQSYPFEALVKKLSVKRDASRNPLFDAMFAFENADERVLRVSDLTFTPYDFKPDAAMADLTLEAVESGSEITLRFEYCAALFKRETVERWAQYYLNILRCIMEKPGVRLFEIEVLPAAEKRKLLVGWNETGASYPTDAGIHHLFEKQVEKSPSRIAAVFGDARLTYEELNRGANRVAHFLRARGVAPDGIVAIVTDRSPLMFFAILGILKAGGAYLPVNPELPEERIRFMLRDSGCKVLLTDGAYGDPRIPGIEAVNLSGIVEAGETSNPPSRTHPGDLAYVLYTSGSTGEPKACLITHQNVVRLMMNDRHPFDFNAADVWTMAHSYAFDFSVWEMYGAFLYGGTLIVPDAEQVRDTAKFLSLIRKHRVTVLNQTPGAFYNLIKEELKSPQRSLHHHLRWVIFGGDRLTPPHLASWFHRYSTEEIALVNMYGITETTVHVTFHRLTGRDAREPEAISPIGSPLPETRVYLFDNHLKPTPIGIPGEMYVGGTGVCRGYLNRPDLTRERFVDNPFHPGETLYRSGDLARRLADGRLLYLGRNDDQVQIRGYRVEPGEVETHLLGHPGVEKAVVAAKTPKGGGHQELVAYIVGKKTAVEGESEDSPNVAGLRQWLSRRLPDYMVPAHFVLMDDFPLTGNAKIDRSALPDPLERDTPALNRGIAYQAPVTDVEQELAAAWEATLGKQNIGLGDNFFDLGGDSIKALQIVSRLNRENLVVDIPDIFRYPTLKELAGKAVRRERRAEQGLISGDAPLTPIQSWFFEAHGGSLRDHFTQAIRLRGRGRLDEAALRAVVEKILEHHDGLRIRCRFEGEGVVLENRKQPLPGSFQTVDLTGVEDPEEQLKKHCMAVPESIDLATGPLLKAVLFRMDHEDRLLIVIHHLVVDGVSWRILIEDLQQAYAQRLSGKPITLPPKTDPFILWARAINEYANSEALLKEKPYWQTVEAEAVQAPSLPVDFETGTNRIKDEKTLTLELSREDTERLLTKANRAYHTEINDILLTALARALKRRHGGSRTLIALERHGREPLFTDLDVSRTVGWFTSLHPFLLALPDSDDPGRQIKQVKEALRQIPNRGIGWGVLKYLTARELKTDLRFHSDPRIIFNYLGRFDEGAETGPFEPGMEPGENAAGSDLERNCDCEIEGLILGGRLRTSIIYNSRAFREETVKRLLDAYHDELGALIGHCESRTTSERTPSDLTYGRLSVEELDELLAREKIGMDDLEDIYPLSPMQEGMLYHVVHGKDPAAYFEQFSFPVYGDFHAGAFEKSWNELIRRHDILRTAFVHKGLDRPLQIVLKERRIDFKREDLSGLGKKARSDRRRQFKHEDRKRMFDPARDVLLRIGVLKLDKTTHEIIWSHHHLLVDGWCMGVIFHELFAIYAAFKNGNPICLTPPTPYGNYIKWLENTDRGAAIDYWKRHLAGYERLATLPNARHGQESTGAPKPAALTYEMPAQSSRALERLAAENRVTVNTIIQSAWGVLLCKHNNVDDVVFGAVVSGRPVNLPGVDKIVGPFVNTVPVRITLDAQPTLMDLIKRTQQAFLDGREHHHCSLADIQAASDLKQGLLDHLVVFENYPLSDELQGLGKKTSTGFSTGPEEEFGRTNYDFTLEVYQRETILFKMKYNARVYDEPLMERLGSGLSRTLEALIAEPGLRLSDARRMLMDEQERKEQDDFLHAALEISEDF